MVQRDEAQHAVVFKPLTMELSALESNGVKVKPPFYPQPFVSKVILLAGTCDLHSKMFGNEFSTVPW